jgi:hypothetical protein
MIRKNNSFVLFNGGLPRGIAGHCNKASLPLDNTPGTPPSYEFLASVKKRVEIFLLSQVLLELTITTHLSRMRGLMGK